MGSVSVPADFIKDAPVYWEAEVLQCLGIPLYWCGANVPPPTLAALAILELLDNDFVAGRPSADGESVAACLYVLTETTAAAELIQPAVRVAGAPPKDILDGAAATWYVDAVTTSPGPADMEALRQWIATALSGHQMIPAGAGGGAGSLYLFGAPAMGSVIAGLAGALGGDAHALLWETSLCLLGHTIAARAVANGTKGVGRPKDRADIKQQLDDAKARDDRGDLHPWQRVRPREYPLSESQAANLETAAQYQEALQCRP